MTLHEVARRVGLRQPSLYVYVASKLDLYDAMFARANAELLARVDGARDSDSAREQLLRLSRVARLHGGGPCPPAAAVHALDSRVHPVGASYARPSNWSIGPASC